ncbi:MAG: SGNH/GDSL hydrolase family protein [Actinobacteria bacterium]|nr:SGNH/GDSL hydrolase family protein [Actinomycetota bacterium]
MFGLKSERVQCETVWSSYIAVGDSFTEGLDDPRSDGSYRGWADRLARTLHERNAALTYANLAIRGRTTERILRDQIPAATAQRPELVTFASGINDLMTPSWEPARTFAAMDESLRQLRSAGADVLVVAFGDPQNRASIRRLRQRFELLNRATVMLAREHGCMVLDFWPLTAYAADDYWSEDRLHLSALGHEVTAAAAAEVLNIGDGAWRESVAAWQGRPPLRQRVIADGTWVVKHAGPWVWRRVRRKSAGEDVQPKRPALASLAAEPLPE